MRIYFLAGLLLVLAGCTTDPEVFAAKHPENELHETPEELERQEKLRAEVEALLASDAEKLTLTEEQWRAWLTPWQYHILVEEGTERAGTGELLHNKEEGVYVTAGCKQPVFLSETKYDSGTGWPSFYAPIEGSIELREDYKLGVKRWEVVSSRCGEHLGHVFPDGPEPTGLRYCMNSAALEFVPN